MRPIRSRPLPGCYDLLVVVSWVADALAFFQLRPDPVFVVAALFPLEIQYEWLHSRLPRPAADTLETVTEILGDQRPLNL